MGDWAADGPARAFLQSSTEDVTFGRWLPEQAPVEGPAQGHAHRASETALQVSHMLSNPPVSQEFWGMPMLDVARNA